MVDETPRATHSVDPESAEWLSTLAGSGAQREAALARLHEMLLRIAHRECRRRSPRLRITGPELEDLAYQAAADALVAELSPRQRQVFVAIAVNAVPLDALAIELSSNRNAIYKMMFDARRKLRAALSANGYMGRNTEGRS